ncbi:MAG: hypothetical protein V1722_02900 [Candidatus Micrarchaeota archaeon]
MPSKIKRPTNWKRIALLTAAAGALVGTVALRDKPVETPSKPTRPPIRTVMENLEKLKPPSGLTWAEAIRRIEQDARQRSKQPATSTVQSYKPTYVSEQDVLDKFAQHEALYSLRSYDGAGYIRRTLPVLHPQVYNEINADFERLLLRYVRGGMPSEFEGADELRSHYEKKGTNELSLSFEDQFKDVQRRAAMYPDREGSNATFLAEMNAVLGDLKSHYFNRELPKRGYSLVPSGSYNNAAELYRNSKLISRATTKDIDRHWQNQRRPPMR